MRLFVALDIEESIRANIARFTDGVREFAPDARWVKPESLHVTLKFIGERHDPEKIKQALTKISFTSFDVTFRGHGFFPTPASARVFWVGMESGPQIADLAKSTDETLIPLGITKETHAFSPHLTLARTGSGRPVRNSKDRPNRNFQRLQEKLAASPAAEFGTMAAREFFLYQSQLSPHGSRYTKIANFVLR
ncbi:MAG TPA: RNA 2',3'-cyclic phosphodiesterase [Terriglobales bacterium]|nr:RNA 2',3'-cyclic phosphodiesterase [Terriglobales bacterium]